MKRYWVQHIGLPMIPLPPEKDAVVDELPIEPPRIDTDDSRVLHYRVRSTDDSTGHEHDQLRLPGEDPLR